MLDLEKGEMMSKDLEFTEILKVIINHVTRSTYICFKSIKLRSTERLIETSRTFNFFLYTRFSQIYM